MVHFRPAASLAPPRAGSRRPRARSGAASRWRSFIAIWQAAIASSRRRPTCCAPPARVRRGAGQPPELLTRDAVTTFGETVIGLVTGSIAGVGCARHDDGAAARPATDAAARRDAGLPVFAIAPLLVLWFGFGIGSKIVMATIAIFFPVASAFHDGLRTPTRACSISVASTAPGHCASSTCCACLPPCRRSPRALRRRRLCARRRADRRMRSARPRASATPC